jgi:hypothetical protein
LEDLRAQALGRWRSRVEVLGLMPGEGRSLIVVVRIGAMGQIWSAGRAAACDSFVLALAIPHSYPLQMPVVRFVRPIPFNPHVVHAGHLPMLASLPPELRDYIRDGEGHCCYLKSSQWRPGRTCDLSMVVWMVSRILTLERTYGEAGSLNPVARDAAFRLAETKALPLGEPLPYPHELSAGDPAAPAPQNSRQSPPDDESEEDEDIEWAPEAAP